jgi:hypothetical protein
MCESGWGREGKDQVGQGSERVVKMGRVKFKTLI